MIRRFEDLRCWQLGRALCREVYRLTRDPGWSEDRPLRDQMRRAAISISSNIAEGFERGSRRQQIEFCYVARGSAGELRSQMVLAHDVSLIDDETYRRLYRACEECSKVLYGYIRSLKRDAERYPGQKYETDAKRDTC